MSNTPPNTPTPQTFHTIFLILRTTYILTFLLYVMLIKKHLPLLLAMTFTFQLWLYIGR